MIRTLSGNPFLARRVTSVRATLDVPHAVLRSTPLARWAVLVVAMAPGVGLLGSSSTAFADPIPMTSLFLNMQGTVCAPKCGRPLNTALAFTTNNAPTSDPLEVLLGGANNDALVSGISDFGVAHVMAQADAFALDGGFGQMDAQTEAVWTDYFTIGGGALAPGTVVQVMASVGMDGMTSVSAGAVGAGGDLFPNNANAYWTFFASMQNVNNPSDFVSVCADALVGCILPPNVAFQANDAAVFNLVVGQMTAITGLMEVHTAAAAVSPGPGGVAFASVTADASHTANFYLQPLGDFTIVSASGHDYLPAAVPAPPAVVPEPASMLLVGSGVAAMIVRRRRGL
jgi:hypothetical protein